MNGFLLTPQGCRTFSLKLGHRVLSASLLFLIKGYQMSFPHLRMIFGVQGHCRYSLSCSEYAASAIQTFGLARGSRLAVKRLMTCHPWAKAA